jgi:hypothetical protein
MGMNDSISPRDPGLPAGVSQSDCDGPRDNFADAGDEELWNACAPRQQEQIAEDFAETRADDVRDALLDASEDAARPGVVSHPPRCASVVGQRIWRAWIIHRDREVGELHRRGMIRDSNEHPVDSADG